jgi:hypothetical protein
MIRIDEKLALELLRKAVEAQGEDHVDPNAADGRACQYVDNQGAPSCIVGHVMVLAGLSSSELTEEGDVWDLCQNLDHSERAYVTRDAIYVLSAAQELQDNRGSWGEALKAAEAGAKIPWMN